VNDSHYAEPTKSAMKKPRNLIIFLFFQKITLFAQSPYAILERPISVNFLNTPLKEALNVVAQAGRFQFSYNARILDLKKKITLLTNGMTVRETLVQILGDNYTYQQSGEYLIIKTRNKPQKILSGYISDAKTGKKVKNVTVYDAKTLRSTTTDENGFYSLKVTDRSTVVVAQLAYKDTILQITEGSPRFVKLALDLKSEPKPVEKGINWGKLPNKLADVFISTLQKLNNANVSDSFHRRFQMSILPYIGTNHKMSGNVINDFSLNIISGYSKGNRYAEVAGLGNFTRGDVRGLQAAGAFNIVKGNVKGVQYSGIFNHVTDTLKGLMQWGGIWNFAYQTKAFNQTAGSVNVAVKGTLNTQFSSITNIADTIKGMQVTGIYNYAKIVKGVQMAAILNQAKIVKGVQIGIFNYADSLDGVQLGVFNFSKKGGFNAIELSTNEINAFNIAYKSGNKKLYMAFVMGITPSSSGEIIWSQGTGIGTMIKLNKWSDLNAELMERHINIGTYSDFTQDWYQLGLYWNVHLNNWLQLNVGPTFNGLETDRYETVSNENLNKIFPSYIKRTMYQDTNTNWDTWVGGNLGLRFRL
jgi:CarboxypepD_reg-like domain